MALLIDSAIVDPRSPDLELPRAADEGALAGVAVAHHQPPAVLVDFVLMGFDVGSHCGFHGLDEHLARSLVQHFIQGRGFLSINDLGVDLTAALSSFTLTHGVSSLFLSRKRLSCFLNRQDTPPSLSRSSTTFGYISPTIQVDLLNSFEFEGFINTSRRTLLTRQNHSAKSTYSAHFSAHFGYFS